MTNLFGTDGIRSHVGTGVLSQNNLHLLGRAISLWAQRKYDKRKPGILLLHDTRASCSWVKACLTSGMLSFEVKLFDAHELPTPAALFFLQKNDSLAHPFDCAVVISASHNPYYDNGIKIVTKDGKLSPEDELVISDLFVTLERESVNHLTLGNLLPFYDAKKVYCLSATSFFKENFLRGKKIVLDCANGATYETAPKIFKDLGAEVIAIFNSPTGYNINKNCGTLHLEKLKTVVLEEKAFAGFAFDGDGDRLMAVNMYGEVKNGDDLLTILLEHKKYKKSKTVVGTIITNLGFEEYLKKKNKKLLRTPVGDKFITKKLAENNLLLGGEQSGHIIIYDMLPSCDGTVSALRILESIIQTKNFEMKSFKKYPQISINLPVKEKPSLQEEPLRSIINELKLSIRDGRAIIRYSGTEPLLRIMIEAKEKNHAEEQTKLATEKLKIIFKKINRQRGKNGKTEYCLENI